MCDSTGSPLIAASFLVDPDVAQIPVREAQPDRRRVIERFKLGVAFREEARAFLQLALVPLAAGDVDKGQHQPVDPTVHRPVRPDAHRECLVARIDAHLAAGRTQGAADFVAIAHDRGRVQPARQIVERPADVTVADAEDARHLRGEQPDSVCLIDEQRRDIGAFEQILEVAVGARQLPVVVCQFGVDRLERLVDRLKFLAACLQLFVGVSQRFVDFAQPTFAGAAAAFCHARKLRSLRKGCNGIAVTGPLFAARQPVHDRPVPEDVEDPARHFIRRQDDIR